MTDQRCLTSAIARRSGLIAGPSSYSLDHIPLLFQEHYSQYRTASVKQHLLLTVHTYYSRFILEEVTETSQIFLRDVYILLKRLSYN
jgi:hypothetical protein